VGHALAAGPAMVDAHVVAVRPVQFVQDPLGLVQGPEQGQLLLFAGFEQGGEMPPGDDHRVPRGDRVTALVDRHQVVLPGKKRYEVRGFLGSGGLGRVYRAFDNNLGREVALKVLHDEPDEQAILRFKREAAVSMTVSHPYIVTIFDADVHGSVPYIAMELLRGRDLLEVVDDGPMDVDEALAIIGQGGSALAYLHQRDILHRDIKLGNIMVDETGRAVLLDFNLAVAMDSTILTGTGRILGTPRYMAPELWHGYAATPRTEVFALALVLHDLLTGVKHEGVANPFENPQPYAAPSTCNDAVNAALDRAVDHALRFEIEERTPTVVDFLRELALTSATARKAVTEAAPDLELFETPKPAAAVKAVPPAVVPAAPSSRRYDWLLWLVPLATVGLLLGLSRGTTPGPDAVAPSPPVPAHGAKPPPRTRRDVLVLPASVQQLDERDCLDAAARERLQQVRFDTWLVQGDLLIGRNHPHHRLVALRARTSAAGLVLQTAWVRDFPAPLCWLPPLGDGSHSYAATVTTAATQIVMLDDEGRPVGQAELPFVTVTARLVVLGPAVVAGVMAPVTGALRSFSVDFRSPKPLVTWGPELPRSTNFLVADMSEYLACVRLEGDGTLVSLLPLRGDRLAGSAGTTHRLCSAPSGDPSLDVLVTRREPAGQTLVVRSGCHVVESSWLDGRLLGTWDHEVLTTLSECYGPLCTADGRRVLMLAIRRIDWTEARRTWKGLAATTSGMLGETLTRYPAAEVLAYVFDGRAERCTVAGLSLQKTLVMRNSFFGCGQPVVTDDAVFVPAGNGLFVFSAPDVRFLRALGGGTARPGAAALLGRNVFCTFSDGAVRTVELQRR